MTEFKTYQIDLAPDLNGWAPLTIRATTGLPPDPGGGYQTMEAKPQVKLAKLKDEYEILDDPDSPFQAVAQVKVVAPVLDRRLSPERNGVEFKLCVPESVRWTDLPADPTFTLLVQVYLDLSGAASIALGAIGMGGLATQLAGKIGMIAGSCKVRFTVPECKLHVEKARWQPINDLDLIADGHVSLQALGPLFAEGGLLWVPITAKPEQEAANSTVKFKSGIPINDVTASLKWMGTTIKGTFRKKDAADMEPTLCFEILKDGKVGAKECTANDKPVEMDLLPQYLACFASIEAAGQKVSTLTAKDLSSELQAHRDRGIEICATKKVEELRKEPYAASFSRRLGNSATFLETTPAIFLSMGQSSATRGLAVKSVIGACTDFTLECLFFFGDYYKGAKLKKQNEQAARECMERANMKSCQELVDGLSEKTAGKLASVVEKMAPISQEMRAIQEEVKQLNVGLRHKTKKAVGALQEAKDALAKNAGDPAAKAAQAEAEAILADSAESMKKIAGLEKRVAGVQTKLIELQEAEKAVKKLQGWLAEMRAAGTSAEVQRLMQNKFGPSSHAAKIIEEARAAAASRINTLIELRIREIELIRGDLPPHLLTPDVQAAFQGVFAEIRALARKEVGMEALEGVFLDGNKNFAQNSVGAAIDKVTAYQNTYKENAASAPSQTWGEMFSGWWNSICGWWDSIKETLANAAAALIMTAIFCVVTGTSFFALLLLGAVIMALCLIVAWFFEWGVGYVENFDRIDASQIGKFLRNKGKETLDARTVKVPEAFFNVAEQKALIKGAFDDLDPDRFPAKMDEATKAQLASEIKQSKASALDKASLAAIEGLGGAFHGMAVEALDISRYEKELPAASGNHAAKFQKSLGEIKSVMKTYQEELAANEQDFFDFAQSRATKIWNMESGIAWPEIATYMKLINSYISLAAKLAICLLSLLPVPKSASGGMLQILGKLALVDIITSGIRMLVCAMGTLPCANAFAMDLLALQGIAFRTLVEGESIDEPDAPFTSPWEGRHFEP